MTARGKLKGDAPTHPFDAQPTAPPHVRIELGTCDPQPFRMRAVCLRLHVEVGPLLSDNNAPPPPERRRQKRLDPPKQFVPLKASHFWLPAGLFLRTNFLVGSDWVGWGSPGPQITSAQPVCVADARL